MLASHRWLTELSGVDASPELIGEALTKLGLEVEDVHTFGEGLEHVVVAEVRAVERVPDKDKLSLVTVFDGSGERKVICGAPNVPEPGGRVVLAMPGAVLPGGFEIAERSVGGVVSSGMLCSETELGIGEGAQGILVLDPGERGTPGQPVVEALELSDHVYEIGLTPNRPDCLGHIGLAREVALAFGKPFRPPQIELAHRILSSIERTDAADELPIIEGDALPVDTLTLVEPSEGVLARVPIRIEDRERCPRYAGAVVQGVTVQRSPWWLRYRLHVLQVRAINNVVDITNLVLLEAGHPIHGFDLARLRGGEIIVRTARAGETIKTLDEVERPLLEDDLLICDAEGPVAVAGVMGGFNSEINASTTDVLVEVAYFDPRSVRRTSRRLGLHTDASHRFERGVDPNGVPWAIRRAVGLLCQLGGGAASPYARDVYPTPIRERAIAFDPAHVPRLMGADISEASTRSALEAIGCSISPAVESGWRVHAPTWRPDLARPEDLVEEVARIAGYDTIPTELPRILPSGRGLAPRARLARRLKEAAADLGLLEAVNFSFVSRADLDRAKVDTAALELANPLTEERSVMRTSLLPGLLGDVARARRHQAGAVTLFECARTYHPREGEALPDEPLSLAIALAGSRTAHVGDDGPFDFYDGKGVLCSIVQAALGATAEAVTDDSLDQDAPFLHPRRRARLRIDGEPVGVLGELHPDVTESVGLDLRVVYGELSVERLLAVAAQRGIPQARPLPRFPSVSRDVALVVPDSLEVQAAQDALQDAGGELLEAVELFDVYRGEGIAEGDKSLAFRVIYRDPESTLTDKRVEKAHRSLLKQALKSLGARQRG